MELSDLIALVGIVASAGIAVWAVIVAHLANGRAREANRIAQESLDLAKRYAPAPWEVNLTPGPKEYLGRLTNTSGRDIAVLGLRVLTPGWENHVDLKSSNSVRYGQQLEYTVDRRLSMPKIEIELEYAFEDDRSATPKFDRWTV
ncbi:MULTISPECIES: hypothetical protein [unclassified Microbacterium]|uniref:hypothetical protein n=1 Tax=unclassified Microbacterium TaxID=2609290 RepID=UPI00301040F1